MKTYSILGLFILLQCGRIFADTNTGLLQATLRGAVEVPDCEKFKPDETCCDVDLKKAKLLLGDFTSLASTNQCVASIAEIEKSGVLIPKCPEGKDQIRGLDSTYPTGGIFVLYNGKPALYQLGHGNEVGFYLFERIACQISYRGERAG